jgi:hypothetical protein
MLDVRRPQPPQVDSPETGKEVAIAKARVELQRLRGDPCFGVKLPPLVYEGIKPLLAGVEVV